MSQDSKSRMIDLYTNGVSNQMTPYEQRSMPLWSNIGILKALERGKETDNSTVFIIMGILEFSLGDN